MKNLKTNNLYHITSANNTGLKRLYKNNYEIQKLQQLFTLLDVSVICILKFGTKFEFRILKQGPKA